MKNTRTKAIIAVFGGDDAEAVAVGEKIGRAIAQKAQVLLTGGTGPGTKSVKESAIAGVGASPWVGVDRGETIGTTERECGFIIHTNLGHKRNYLEACLCDAAIGLKGSGGTLSEVVFALSLRRPVALVGDHWRLELPLETSNSEALSKVVDRVFRRVGLSSGSSPLDKKLNKDEILSALNKGEILRELVRSPPHKYVSSTNGEDVVDWIIESLRAPGLQGAFPSIDRYEDAAEQYNQWLTRHALGSVPA